MAKNPILIVPNTELCRLIILEAHGPYHNSTGHTIAEVRQQYWIPRLQKQLFENIIAELLTVNEETLMKYGKEFRSQVETEIREAELQEQRENHINAFVQTKEEIEHLHCEFKQYYTEIKGHTRNLSENVYSIREELRRNFEQGFAEIDKRITNQNEYTHTIKEELRRDFKQYFAELNKRITNQSENINSMREILHREFGQCRKEIKEQIRDQSGSIKGSIELTKNSLETRLAILPSYAPKTDQEPTMPKEVASEGTKTKNWTEGPTSKHQDPVGQRNVREEEVEEDLLDLYDDYECTEQKDSSERASTYTRKSIRQKKEHAEKERSEQLDERRARIEEFLRYNREVPERKIRRLNYMRSEERFLTCSFCLARGEHYSDSCPEKMAGFGLNRSFSPRIEETISMRR
ncbi:hypothetical protein NECAME_15997 [Necator americanus]|uniref:Uncharacterized protein n=1 Tax=Necator americanus TaxID=51031 RepID=W2U0V4_NECAM|nr:hypothetical protein NECAME_15997 [Necator americanus]ETN86991.1 hypothetical protein NECAME_15997 [Necator americanus]